LGLALPTNQRDEGDTPPVSGERPPASKVGGGPRETATSAVEHVEADARYLLEVARLPAVVVEAVQAVLRAALVEVAAGERVEDVVDVVGGLVEARLVVVPVVEVAGRHAAPLPVAERVGELLGPVLPVGLDGAGGSEGEAQGEGGAAQHRGASSVNGEATAQEAHPVASVPLPRRLLRGCAAR